MPNPIIIVGMATNIGNVHLRYRYHREVEDEVTVNGITKDGVGDEEEDTVGDSRVPKEYQRMLL